jgi:putative transposon-encoded protein
MTHWDTAALGFSDMEAIGFNHDAGTLFIASTRRPDKYLGEMTTTGTLLRAYDLSFMPDEGNIRSDVSYAPGSQNPAIKTIYIASRGIDNDGNRYENDGKVWEISIGSGPVVPTPTYTPPVIPTPTTVPPEVANWHIHGQGAYLFGEGNDIPIPGDYNGDGRDDIAVYRPSNRTWYLSTVGNFQFGQSGDIAVPGDYNGDGRDDVAVYRPSNRTWYLSTVGNFQFGQSGDIAVPGDYNGDGRDDIAVFRPSSGIWYISTRGNFGWGEAGDIPVAADYNGDGLDDIAIFRP